MRGKTVRVGVGVVLRVVMFGLVLASGAGRLVAQSGDVERAREQFRQGNEAYNAGNYEEAIRRFQEANSIAPNARLDLYIGQAYIHLGNSGAALEHIRAYAASSSEARAEVAPIIEELEQAQSEIVAMAQRGVGAAWCLAAGVPCSSGGIEEVPDYTNVPVVPIQVRSTPAGAEVFIDDENLGSVGRTPLSTELFVGPHHIIVKLPYHATHRELVNVTRRSGTVPIISVNLERQDVLVSIRFNPITARGVYVSASGETIDLGMGSFSGELPAGDGVFIIQRSGSSRRIERSLSAEGGVQEFTLNLDPGDDIEVRTRELGTLIIRSNEARVRITVDGVEVGRGTGEFESPQTPGPHTIRVSREGYETVEDTITVNEGERLTWTVPRLYRR